MAERVIDSQEEPGVAALRYHRSGQARRQRVAVIDPGRFGRRARLTREGCAAYRPRNGDPIMLGRELFDGKRHGRIVEADGHVHFFSIEPVTGNGRPDIGLILVIGEYDTDRLAEHCAASVLCRHSRGDDRTWAAQVGVEAGLVVKHANPDDIIRYLTACARGANDRGCKGYNKRDWKSHDTAP